MISSTEALFLGKRAGTDLDEYLQRWQRRDAESMSGLGREERSYRFYSRYNLERFARVQRAFELGDGLRRAAEAVREEQTWLFITEDWCADAAYSLPVFAAAANVNPLISLSIVERDEHPEIIDRYLTQGGRSIPIVAVFGSEASERLVWGPRPAALSEARDQWDQEGIEGREMSRRTIEWYENDSWVLIERELTDALVRSTPGIHSAA